MARLNKLKNPPPFMANLKEVKMRRTTMLVICAVFVAFSVGSVLAQTVPQPLPDSLKVDYFANANTTSAPDATLRLDNPGTAGGSVCANLYVFDVFQEMSECCSCYISPDGLRTLSINNDLTANPLTGKQLTTGVIKIVSNVARSTVCPLPRNMTPVSGGVRGWATHIQNASFTETETGSLDATMNVAEESRLNAECNSIALTGSGSGVCTCGTGD
jgi:hypothetical protein